MSLIKRSYKVNFISSINELVRMVDLPSTIGINKAQLVRTHNGRVIVLAYKWASFLEQYFNKIPNIKSTNISDSLNMSLAKGISKRIAHLLNNPRCS